MIILQLTNTQVPTVKGEERLEHFLLISIGLFVLVSLIFFCMIELSRSIKISKKTRIDEFSPECEKMLMQLLFEEIEIDTFKNLHEVKKALINKFLRSVLLTELLHLHENFEGEYAAKLELFYAETPLIKDSKKKLKSPYWQVKCQAIKELTEMKVTSAYSEIFKYARHRNKILRREAQLSSVSLQGFKGLGFLNDYADYISDWEQLNLISILGKIKDDAPDFSTWLSSENESLRIFALRLIIHFNQVDAVPRIVAMIGKSSQQITTIAIQALSKLQAQEEVVTLIRLYGSGNKLQNVEILKALAVLGDESNIMFLRKQLNNPEYVIKFNAVKALQNITRGNLQIETTDDTELEKILQHIEDRRLDE